MQACHFLNKVLFEMFTFKQHYYIIHFVKKHQAEKSPSPLLSVASGSATEDEGHESSEKVSLHSLYLYRFSI